MHPVKMISRDTRVGEYGGLVLQQSRHRISVDHNGQDSLHCLYLALIRPFLQLAFEIRKRSLVIVQIVDETPRVFHVVTGDFVLVSLRWGSTCKSNQLMYHASND